MIKAVGFDLGETLFYNEGIGLNWMEHYLPAIHQGLNKLQISHSQKQLQVASEILTEYNTRVHPRKHEISCDIIFKRIIEEAELSSEIDLNKFENEFFAYFSKNKQVMYDDAEPVLLKLKALGYTIGYLTDVPYGQKRPPDNNSKLILQKLLSISPVYISSVDIGYRKPDGHGFLELANRCNCKAKEIVYVGNEEKDVIGSKKVGMISCLITRNGEFSNWGQNVTINSLFEIFEFLEMEPKRFFITDN